MHSDRREGFSPPAVGGVSLLVTFAVLCLTVFALLSLSTVRAHDRLSAASAQAVADYYEADREAQEIFARIRSGDVPADVVQSGERYSYGCRISDTQRLEVELERTADGFSVVRWQAAPAGKYETDESLSVWDGD